MNSPGGGAGTSSTGARLTFSELAPHVRLLTLAGELDYFSAPTLMEAFQREVDEAQTHYVVDLDAVSYLDTSGLGFLLSLLESCRQRDGELVVVASRPHLLRVLSKTNLDRVLTCVTTIPEAVDRLPEPPPPARKSPRRR